MMVRRTLDGALKCALRDFLLEAWRSATVSISFLAFDRVVFQCVLELILVILAAWGSCRVVDRKNP